MFMGLLFLSFLVWLPNCSGKSGCPAHELRFIETTNRYARTFFFGLRSDDYWGMREITTCFWLRTSQKTNAIDAIVSYATGSHDNELLIGLVHGNIKIWMFDHHGHGCFISTDVFVSDNNWHHVCFTWKSKNGEYSIYKDGDREYAANKSCTKGKAVPTGGALVIGQDQDNFGGGFEYWNSFDGELSEFNFWNSVLSSKKIANMAKSCRPNPDNVGNVYDWDRLIESHHLKNLKALPSTCCNA